VDPASAQSASPDGSLSELQAKQAHEEEDHDRRCCAQAGDRPLALSSALVWCHRARSSTPKRGGERKMKATVPTLLQVEERCAGRGVCLWLAGKKLADLE